jgi:hypothetical protein
MNTVKCKCCKTNDIPWPLPCRFPEYLGLCINCQEFFVEMQKADVAQDVRLEEEAAAIAGVPYPIHSKPLITLLAELVRDFHKKNCCQ